MVGVFVALDMFLFYVFWEMTLVPMYFLIGIWGGPKKEYAAIKFFLFTLSAASSCWWHSWRSTSTPCRIL